MQQNRKTELPPDEPLGWDVKIVAATLASLLIGLGWLQTREHKRIEDDRARVIRTIGAAEICTTQTAKQQPELQRTLAPLLDLKVEDQGQTGQMLIDHAQKQRVDIMFCKGLGMTALFYKSASGNPVICLDEDASDKQQQAAALKLVWLFSQQGAAMKDTPLTIDPTSRFSRVMPGKIPDGEKIEDRVPKRPNPYGALVFIP